MAASPMTPAEDVQRALEDLRDALISSQAFAKVLEAIAARLEKAEKVIEIVEQYSAIECPARLVKALEEYRAP